MSTARTMKPIKIIDSSSDTIIEALKAVNGEAERHAFSAYYEIEMLAEVAEAKLEELGIPKAMRAGAMYHATSGADAPASYTKKGFSRTATYVRLERRAGGWYLAGIAATVIYQKGGLKQMSLTAEQAQRAIDNVTAQFQTQPAATQAPEKAA